MVDPRVILRTIAFWVSAVLAFGCGSAFSKPNGDGDFAIYLVKPGITAQQMMEMELSWLELEKEPILSIDDIITYTWETHKIEITHSARERLAQLEVPLTTGVPFVVCVGNERIYSGALWVSWSSTGFIGVVIDTLFAKMNDQPIRIQLGYPEAPELFEGNDPRSDPRILESLRMSGKLK